MSIAKNKIKINIKSMLILLFIMFLSVISTIPAFTDGFFKFAMDGSIHFIRFESIAQAFKNGQLPSYVNFMGFGNVGETFNSMYPWITAMIFIIPRAVMKNPIHAMFVGFVALNFLTIINTYLLTRCLTNKKSIRIFGILIYQFNTYHLSDMYARNAIGESLAYAFLPLVFMGCYQIWHKRNKNGIISLALGMGLVFNSHLITAFFTTILILIVEIIRLFFKRISRKEILSFIISSFTCIPVVLFSIINIATVSLANHIQTPWKDMIPIDAWSALHSTISNIVSEDPHQHNIGIVCLFLMCAMLILSLKKELTKFSPYIFGSWSIFILTLNWFSLPKFLKESILGNLQFTCRLLPLSMILLTIGSVLILNNYSNIINIRLLALLTSLIIVALSYNSILNYHNTKNDGAIRYYVTKDNYLSTISEAYWGYGDYALIDKNNKTVFKEILKHDLRFKIEKIEYNKIKISSNYTSKKNSEVPFLMYNSIPYNVTVNGKPIDIKRGTVLKLDLKHRKSTIVIQSDAPKTNYFTFAVSLISIIILTSAMASYNRNLYQY